ncbi:MAG TPA: PQQ-binding-like beta-propeller repeat protein [Polyangiaceae bacterium]|nr:PQQ-binding-like beta-propeller repeat protein [Polyangiaceae bacterium]
MRFAQLFLRLGLTSILGVCGCEASRAGAYPEVPVWVHRPSWSMDITFSRDLRAHSRQKGEPYERGGVELDVAGRRVFVGSSDDGLYALHAEDGTVIWRFETVGAVQSEPLYDPVEDTLYFGSNDGALYKVRAEDGKLMWRFMSNAEVSRRPQLVNGTLYAVNANDTLLALNATTGQRRWSQHRTPALGMEIAGHGAVLVWRNKAYMVYSDGTVTAYDAKTGVEAWQPIDLSGEAEQQLGEVPRYLDVDTTPVAGNVEGNAVVYVGGYEGGVYALDADAGNIVWSIPAVTGVTDLILWEQPAHRNLLGDGPDEPARKILIAATGTSGLWGIDPQSGSELWRRDLPDGGVSRPVPMLGALLVSTTRQGLFLVHPLDGRLIDGIHSDLGFAMPAAAYGHRAFIMTNGGKLLGLYVRSPQKLDAEPYQAGLKPL